jgi:cytochrome b involved in lipid metabolism
MTETLVSGSSFYESEDEEKEEAVIRRYYTPAEVAIHNRENDCWLSWLGKVYNLTELIGEFEQGSDDVLSGMQC